MKSIYTAVFAIFFFVNAAYAQTNPTPQSLPYSQDFSTLVSSSTVYPAGWQGWQYSTSPGGGFQYTSATGDKSLIASGGASSTTGGPYNFNGKIGFLITSSLDNGLVLAVNTTGNTIIYVQYDAMTIRNQQDGTTSNNRVNGLELQYRVGTSGNFKPAYSRVYFNQQGSAFNQTGSGVTTPQNLQTISVLLPSECDNQSIVQLRWVSRQICGAGGRPSFAIDNIDVRQNGLAVKYYWKGSGSLNSTSSWGTNSDGSGSSPSDFITNQQTFTIKNSATATISSNWIVSGTGSKIIIGDGVNNTGFTVPSANTVTGAIDISSSGTLTINNNTFPVIGNNYSGSTIAINLAASTTALPSEPSYYNLSLVSGSAITYTSDLGSPSLFIRNNFLLDGCTFDIASFSGSLNAFNFRLGGNLTMQNSASTTSSFQNWVELRMNGTADQTIKTNGTPLTINSFRIENDATKKIILSSDGGTSNLSISAGSSTETLTMSGGNLDINSNTLTLGSSSSNLGTLSYTSGLIIGGGTFTRWLPASGLPTSFSGNLALFPIGAGTYNRMVKLSFNASTISAAGTISVSHQDAPGTTMLTSFTEGTATTDRRHNMSWTISGANGIDFGLTTASLRLEGMGITDINSLSDLNLILVNGPAGGTFTAATGTTSDASVNRSSLQLTDLTNTFYFGGNSGSPLPVTISSFTCRVLSNYVTLSWTTLQEINNKGFEIERTISPSAWKKIGFLHGHGTINEPQEYSFSDVNLNTGKYYYRIKQIDYNGNFEYFILNNAAQIGTPEAFNVKQNFPNPFNPVTQIAYSLPFDSHVRLDIYDAAGKLVKDLVNSDIEKGYHAVEFNGADIASGIYYYRLIAKNLNSNDEYSKIMKMVLIK